MWVKSITVLNDYDTSLTFTSVLVAQLCLTFCNAWTLTHQAPLSMEFSSKNTGVSSHSLLQGILPTQGSNPCLLHCRQILTVWATREASAFTRLACNSLPNRFLLRGRSSLYKMHCGHINLYYSEQNQFRWQISVFLGTFKFSLNWKAIKSLCLQIIHLIVPQIWQSSWYQAVFTRS